MPFVSLLFSVGVQVAPYFMVTTLFTIMYLYIPNTRVRLRPALIGAVVAGVLWAAVGIVFTRFVEYSAHLTLVYAGFAAVIAVVTWTYFGWLILLSGAQLSFYIQKPSYLRFGLSPLLLSAAEFERLALTVAFLVADNAATEQRRYTLDSLAARLDVTGVALAPLITALEQARVLKVSGETLLLARDPTRLAIVDIVEAARQQHSGRPISHALPDPGISHILAQVDAARRASCTGATLRDVLQAAQANATRRQSSDRQ